MTEITQQVDENTQLIGEAEHSVNAAVEEVTLSGFQDGKEDFKENAGRL